MTSPVEPATGDGDAERRRLEALDHIEGSPWDDEEAARILDLVCRAVFADHVGLSVVSADHSELMATTATCAGVRAPRTTAVAGRAVTAEAISDVVVRDAAEVGDHPLLDGMTLPVRWCAVPIRAPGGEIIAALEALWEGDAPLEAATSAALELAAGHAEHVLELRAEVNEYQRFVELAPDAVLVLDVAGDILLANPALCDLLGYGAPEQLIGRTFVDLVVPQDRMRVAAELGRLLFSPRRTSQLELALTAAAGHEVRCSVSSGNLRGPRRRLQLVVHDLSDRLRHEEERARLSEQLARAQRLDAVGQIASGLAHDLNNLLVVMTSNLSLADESLAELTTRSPGEEVTSLAQDLGEIRTAVERANDLTAKLLQFARQEDRSARPTTSDVAEVVEAVQTLVDRTLPRPVQLDVQMPDALPPVAADPVQLERVLLNLIINSRDAIDGGGTITVSADRVAPSDDPVGDPPDISASAAGREFVRLDVVDDGAGMDEVTQARSLEPLWTSKGAEGGTGLGLATVASFVDEVDGSLSLDSEPGEGTRVTLHVPSVSDREKRFPGRRDVPVGGARVVLLEPGERTRRVITRMLEGSGYRVRAFGSAAEALRSLASDGADLFVAELSLPETSGERVLAVARETVPDLGVVVLTTVDGPGTLDGTPVLVKPFSHTRLLQAAERVLPPR